MCWKEVFEFGPFGVGLWCGTPFRVQYSSEGGRNILRIKLRGKVKKEDIKVRLSSEGILEISWPSSDWEEIEVG